MQDSRRLIASGMFLMMLGGWLDWLCTYRGVLDGLEYGLNFPVFRCRGRFQYWGFASVVPRDSNPPALKSLLRRSYPWLRQNLILNFSLPMGGLC